MTQYRILSPNFVATLVEAGDAVVQSAPVLSWTVGMSFSTVRDYCQSRGWQIEPMLETHRPQWLEYHGTCYELEWRGNTLLRITEHSDGETRALSFSELPEPLQSLL